MTKMQRILPLSCACIALILSCAKVSQQHTWLDFFVGRVEVLGAGGGIKPAEIRMPLELQDTVRTREKSMAFVQCGADTIIQVRENSELSLATLPERMDSSIGTTALQLVRGAAAFYVESIKKGGSFRVKALGTQLAVRGTLFSASLAGGALTVAVKEGSVSVKSETGAYGEFAVTPGKKARIEGSAVKIENMGAGDEVLFMEIRKVRPIAGIGCTPPEYIERFFNWRLDIVVPKDAEKSERDVPGDEGSGDRPGGSAEGDRKTPAASVRTRLVVSQLVANGVESSEAAGISRKIFSSLSAEKGGERVVLRGAGDWRSANRILTGRVSKLGSSRIIALSVADAQKGSVLYSKTVTSREGDDLDAQMAGVAREISARTSIWE